MTSQVFRQLSLALLGGPDSGKTTYLGALVLGLENAPETASLQMGPMDDDARGLRRLAEPLRRGEYPQRTKGERNTLNVGLRTRSTTLGQKDFNLNIADYDGEEIERLFDQRAVPTMQEWRARAESKGLLLFVRPDALTPLPALCFRPPIAFHHEARALPFSPESISTSAVCDEVPPPRPLAPDEAVRLPTVLGLVELLQYLRGLRGLSSGERPKQGDFRVAIILPSWDAVAPKWQQRRPVEYIVEHAPLLMDYMWSNFEQDDVFYFGLSATGGDLKISEHKKRYKRQPQGALYFARTNGTVAVTADLALPILWALFGDEVLQLA